MGPVCFVSENRKKSGQQEATRQRALANGWETADSDAPKEAKKKRLDNRIQRKRRNFTTTSGISDRRAKTRYKWNVEAISFKTAKVKEGLQQREQKISLYAGWAESYRHLMIRIMTGQECAELKELLTEDEYVTQGQQ